MAVVVSCDRDYFVLYSIYQKLQMLPQALIAVDWLTGWWMIPSFLCAWAKISVWLVLVLLLLFCFFFYFTTNFSLVARCFFCSHRNRLRFVLVFWQTFYHFDCVCMEQFAVYAFSWRWSGCDHGKLFRSFSLSFSFSCSNWMHAIELHVKQVWCNQTKPEELYPSPQIHAAFIILLGSSSCVG